MNTLRKRLMRKFFMLLALMLVIVLLGTGSALAAASVFVDNLQIPFELFVYVPCAAGGLGEDVYLSGTLHLLFRTTFDNQGGYHSTFHYQPQGISGVGLLTGDRYQATGETQGTDNGRVGYESTFVNNFKIIGQGSGNNFLIHENIHYTITANGEITAFVDNFSVECR